MEVIRLSSEKKPAAVAGGYFNSYRISSPRLVAGLSE
jgi:hypothetical protein